MITEKDRQAIVRISRKYHASRVLLFGSSILESVDGHDIDIGVEGIPDRDFFIFYGELMRNLSKPVDVIDLARESKFTDAVLKEGVSLYA